MGKNPRRLVGQVLGRVDDFVLKRYLMPGVLTVLDLFDLPSAHDHAASPDYASSLQEAACERQ